MSEADAYPLGRIEFALARQASVAQARSDAFSFAVKCKANVSWVQAEIQSVQTSMQQMLANKSYGKNNPMAPGAGPRVYRDAYLAGLLEALALIDELSSDRPT